MFFSESWLRSLVNPPISTEELSHRLTMAGLEVEETRPAAPAFSGVVVAQITAITPHPNADKLRVCQVDDGSGQLLQIVCGAPNAAQGIKVPLAKIGAKLPDGLTIGKVKMRGEVSLGMLCSARELALSQEHSGLLILKEDAQVGQDIREALNLDDTIFEIKLTPNRADCLSLLGVAREVSALTATPLKAFDFSPVKQEITDTLAVEVQAPDLCGRFSGRVIRGVNAKVPTPDYIKERLERAGQRPVSALVDISNYVLLELGRPTHVFDLNKITHSLVVRWAKSGESVQLLNEQTIVLDEKCGVICDGDQPECLAGVMGGARTAVDLDTTDIFLEAAFWYPQAIAGLTRRFKLSSEAAHRFERGVDFLNTVEHLNYLSRLIIEICGGQAGPMVDEVINLPSRELVRLRTERCQKVLGIQISATEIKQIFTQLQLPFEQQGDDFIVTPPSYRFDLEIEEDLIEEVARIYGYERIPTQAPKAVVNILPTYEGQRSYHAIRQMMVDEDYQEVVNYSFVDENWERDYQNNNPIRLLNPITSQLAVMRSSLLGGLLANVVTNARHKQSRVRIFELGKVFKHDATVSDGDLSVAGIDQPLHLGAVAWGLAEPEQWGEHSRQVDFFDVKNDLVNLFGPQGHQLRFTAETHPALHPGRCAVIYLHEQAIGYIGELHPQWLQALELNHPPVVFEINVKALLPVTLPKAVPVSNQPVVIRDLAIWSPDSLQYQIIEEVLQDAIHTLEPLNIVQSFCLFDIWKDNKVQTSERSLALRFVLQDAEATLEDRRVEQCMQIILQVLVDKLCVRQR